MALTPRATDFSEWYNQLVEQADLAQHSAVRGCMVIKPYGYAIRENMQQILDKAFKATGHQNAYFPIFIPKSFFTREAKHVEHFATEAAIVTHYRMKRDEVTGEIIVDPDAKLEEELIVRPTSETIIRDTYRDWIKSYRDLPLLINQRANVVRREMRTRYFLRTTEFLRQEGHTAHVTAEEAIEETERMRHVYHEFLTKALAIDGVMGLKTENERFAGGEETYTIECMMQDGKAIQACTSHFLGQNFGKAFDVQFTTKDNQQEYARATSRGISTRSYGAMIMSHSDDKGLVLPPAIAPMHVMIVPIAKDEAGVTQIKNYLSDTVTALESMSLGIGSHEDAIVSHVSDSHPPKSGLSIKSRKRAVGIIKHPTQDQYMILYTKGTSKLHVWFGGGVDDGETWIQGLKRELLEETGYRDIAHIHQIGSEHHRVNAGDDGEYNYRSEQRCFFVQLKSLDQKPLAEHEQGLHDILRVSYDAVESLLQDNHTVHHGSVYRSQYRESLDTHKPFSLSFARPLIVKMDDDLTKTMGRKANQYELQGVPLRVTVGPRDMSNGVVEVYRRDLDTKQSVKIEELADYCHRTLHEMQSGLLAKNKAFREANTVSVNTREDFAAALDAGKFILAHRDGTTETEILIKEETKATIRCIPIQVKSGKPEAESGLCIKTGKPSKGRVLFARAY